MKNIKDLVGAGKVQKVDSGGSPSQFSLSSLINADCFVGWIYYIDYKRALLLTNDLWKHEANGIPHNCFLLAAAFDPKNFDKTDELDKEVILLRVTDSAKLPQDDDLVRSRIDYYQQQKEIYKEKGFDPITLNQMQFGALECRVLGTFYTKENNLWLGSDLESFPSASRLKTYRPKEAALEVIANYVDPIRKNKTAEESIELGMTTIPQPFRIGTIRYTSTTRLQQGEGEKKVPVCIQPSDFLARRTAVLGMTRTGKSNMIKQLVSVVRTTSKEGGLSIGQIIFDMNGEYANANRQDKGSIADALPEDTIRYRMLETEGFRQLKNNFYVQLEDGYSLLQEIVSAMNNSATDVKVLLALSFAEPDATDWGERGKFDIRKAAYWGLLNRSQFRTNSRLKTRFKANQKIKDAVNEILGKDLIPENGLTPSECTEWFSGLRKRLKQEQAGQKAAGKRRGKNDDGSPETIEPVAIDWLEGKDEIKSIMNIMESKNENDMTIAGWKLLLEVSKFHSSERDEEVSQEIYNYLRQGKVVILDLSVGRPSIRQKITTRIAEKIFNESMNYFIDGKLPPNIVMYVEEAHNLIGKDADIDSTWPRIAKEGAKYRIALVYATQEVSAMHSNILANTENWFITHLNNVREVNELSKFYDFEDFGESLIRAQDVGFARVKSLSSPYVIPVQIDKFDPAKLKGK